MEVPITGAGEDDAADGRVEGGRDAARGAARDEGAALRDGAAREHTHHRAKGRADLDDRALAADGSASANRERRRKDLDARDAGPDSIISVADAMVIATTTATAGGAERRPQHQCAPLSILCEADALG